MRARLFVLLALSAPTLVSADAVGPDPTDCPTGSSGRSCHGLEYCRPRTCSVSTDCNADEVCQSRDFCVTSGTCGFQPLPDASPPPPVSIVTTCGVGCSESSCSSLMVCVPDGTPPGTGDAGCGCRVAGSGSPLLGLSLLAGLGLLVLVRRL